SQSIVDAHGGIMEAIQVTGSETTAASVGVSYFGLHCKTPSGSFVNGHRGISVDDHGSRASDFNLFSNGTATSGKAKFTGPVICTQSVRTDTASNTDFAGQLTLVAGSASYVFAATFISVPIIMLYNMTN